MVLDVCRAAGLGVVGVVDDNPGCAIASGVDPVAWLGKIGLGKTDHIVLPDGAGWILALGDTRARERLIQRLDESRAAGPVIHPGAVVSPHALLGDGVVVMPGAVVNRDARVGAHAIINTRAVVEHDCLLGVNTHIAPGAVLGGGVAVGDGTLVGIQASVLPGVRIGRGCVVGAGAVVVRDAADGSVVAGVPAREINARVV